MSSAPPINRAKRSLSRLRNGPAMGGEPTAQAAGVVTALRGASAAWPDELWAGSVGWFDAMLRSYYGIYEFTDDPRCVFRVALEEARAPALLSDGTRIRVGEVIGTLHFWNEHLPRYSLDGPDLAWACVMRDHLVHSLRALAGYIDSAPIWREVRALRGDAVLSSRLGAPQIRRVAQRYGFERIPMDPTLFRRLHDLGENFILWGLTRAFNPAALTRQPFLREHHDLWITRATLQRRYGAPPAPVPEAEAAALPHRGL